MVTASVKPVSLPDKTYVCKKGRCQQAGAHLIVSSVIYIKIGRRLQMAAVQDLVYQARAGATRSHCAVHSSISPQLIVRTLSTGLPPHPKIDWDV